MDFRHLITDTMWNLKSNQHKCGFWHSVSLLSCETNISLQIHT